MNFGTLWTLDFQIKDTLAVQIKILETIFSTGIWQGSVSVLIFCKIY